jgi:hypothetical protein
MILLSARLAWDVRGFQQSIVFSEPDGPQPANNPRTIVIQAIILVIISTAYKLINGTGLSAYELDGLQGYTNSEPRQSILLGQEAHGACKSKAGMAMCIGGEAHALGRWNLS